MEEILIQDKQKYLNENHPTGEELVLTDKRECLHCGEVITVGDYKVFKEDGIEYIYCPNAPECDGTVIDWMPVGYKTMK